MSKIEESVKVQLVVRSERLRSRFFELMVVDLLASVDDELRISRRAGVADSVIQRLRESKWQDCCEAGLGECS